MSQHSKRKRHGTTDFQWHADGQGTVKHGDEQPRTTRFRHTTMNLDATGTSSSSTVYIAAPASPEKRDIPVNRPYESEGEGTYDDLPALEDCEDSDDEDDTVDAVDVQLDPQYQQHLTVLEFADAPRAQKARARAVSHIINIVNWILK